MTLATGFWSYHPTSGETVWSLPDGVSLDGLDAAGRVRLRNAILAAASHPGRPPVNEECRVDGPAGDEIWLAIYGGGQFSEGRCRQVCGIVADVSARVRRDHLTELAIDELSHRLGNAVAVAGSIAALTLTTAVSLTHARSTLSARLAAMARGWRRVAREADLDGDIRSALADVLAPFGQMDRFALVGPRARLCAHLTPAFSLVIHELATNAVKYGALSNMAGRVTIGWEPGDDGRLAMEWREQGGPPVNAPDRAGVGAGLIERALSGEGARVRLAFEADGARCVMAGLRLAPPADIDGGHPDRPPPPAVSAATGLAIAAG